MRTQLSQFCEHFETTVRPLLEPLQRALSVVQVAGPDTPGAGMKSELAELAHQIGSLVDKVAGGQAYVLLFGPLKSGKSTLMNAVSAAYVSEVSSLPAYPCLVFVSHSDKREFIATDYDGHTQCFDRGEDLHDHIHGAHAELAAAIRSTESAGQLFEPKEHFPAAIRRIDVRVKAKSLAESGAVLVDTPGLYVRMRFGYDGMTRDFRNAAACAVFVVKSDTLFLEQVFAEFGKLLELFSRIFLVVNMDSTKRDVGPDGQLVPSLEQKSPERIIEAFETLAMPGPLKEAAEDGRVRIYPIDLMHAASCALSRDKKGKEEPPGFAAFRADLTSYLASADYLAAFLGDSLQRAHSLVGELERLVEGDGLDELRAETRAVERRVESCRGDLGEIDSCIKRDWSDAFAKYEHELREEVQRRSRDLGARVARAMASEIDTWFLSGQSLDWLLQGQWQPLVDEYRHEVDRTAAQCFDKACVQVDAGLELAPDLAGFLRSVGIEIVTVRQTAHRRSVHGAKPSRVRVPMDSGEIPLRRGVLDFVALRSTAIVRRNVFGPNDKPDRKIPARIKSARLGEAAKHYMREQLLGFQKKLFDKTVEDAMRRYGSGLAKATVEVLQEQLRERRPDLESAIERLQRRETELAEVLAPLEVLHGAAGEIRAKLHALATQYSARDPEELIRADDAVIDPQSPRPPARGDAARRRKPRRRTET